MLGTGILKGLAETARNFVGSYSDKERLTTVQYPEERLPAKEAARQFPFLVFDTDDPQAGLRCVACQICEKECPPQCIYIEKSKDKKPDYIGKPQLYPAVFDIDLSVCMSCQICVEVCPFEAIKMDTEFELSSQDRFAGLHRESAVERLEQIQTLRFVGRVIAAREELDATVAVASAEHVVEIHRAVEEVPSDVAHERAQEDVGRHRVRKLRALREPLDVRKVFVSRERERTQPKAAVAGLVRCGRLNGRIVHVRHIVDHFCTECGPRIVCSTMTPIPAVARNRYAARGGSRA